MSVSALSAVHGAILLLKKFGRTVIRPKSMEQTWRRTLACGRLSLKDKFWKGKMRLRGL